ncbi:unnamed protein product, partial [Heligmosomoides polygyrus]|uniref:Transposase_23 domain-containing protein n=1 Tax=Heligmosomoides polygyrus TaxID=6339 RepID=A0A183F8W4_HELPZ
MDLNDYKHELLAAIHLGQECSKEINNAYTAKMKAAYDKINKTDVSRLPKVGDRVYVRLPREKANKQYPKLCEPWGGSYRVIETSDNSALLANINENVDPIRVQHDMLIILPQGIDSAPLKTSTKRRATTDGDGDTSPLSMFYTCPGRNRSVDIGYHCDCSVGEMLFRDVVPEADETLGKLHFDNVYSLARLISIYECERSADRKRLTRDT